MTEVYIYIYKRITTLFNDNLSYSPRGISFNYASATHCLMFLQSNVNHRQRQQKCSRCRSPNEFDSVHPRPLWMFSTTERLDRRRTFWTFVRDRLSAAKIDDPRLDRRRTFWTFVRDRLSAAKIDDPRLDRRRTFWTFVRDRLSAAKIDDPRLDRRRTFWTFVRDRLSAAKIDDPRLDRRRTFWTFGVDRVTFTVQRHRQWMFRVVLTLRCW